MLLKENGGSITIIENKNRRKAGFVIISQSEFLQTLTKSGFV